MEVRKGYKQTEIGVLPLDWEVKKLGEISNVSAGGTPNRGTASYWNGNIAWVTTTLIDFNTITFANEFITEEGLDNSAAKICKVGTLLMAMYGQGKTRGKVAILGIDAATNQACATINLNRDIVKEYVFLNLSGRYDEIRSLSNTGNQENLSGELIKGIPIPFPPTKEEQTAIATALRDADALISSLEKLIDKKRNIKQGAMQKLLTGKKRLSGFTDEWGVEKLKELAEMSSGGTPLTSNSNFYNGNISWVVIADITKAGKYISETEKSITQLGLESCSAKLFKKGVLLFAMYASIGKCTIALKEITCNQAILGIQTTKIDTEFLYYYLAFNEKKFSTMGQTGTQSNLNKEIVQELDIPFPKPEEQKAIAKLLSDMDDEIGALEIKLEKYKKLKQGMMQNLLTGKIRLV